MNTKHFEVHLVATVKGADSAQLVGLPEIPLDPTNCSSCGANIGRAPQLKSKFIPLVLILDEDDASHLICMRCAAPILDPRVDSLEAL